MITYEDKVALNENAEIADINKVTAGDMNQIKQVVNGQKQEIDTNSLNIGTLSSLNTIDKSSIVNAINEVNMILGTIIESGSDENGSWVKYSDGTMICYKNKSFGDIYIGSVWGSMYESAKLEIGDFPQPFVGNFPSIFIMPLGAYLIERNQSFSLTSFGSFWVVRPDQATRNVQVSCFAIGKWK
jgi:hypothetical protein